LPTAFTAVSANFGPIAIVRFSLCQVVCVCVCAFSYWRYTYFFIFVSGKKKFYRKLKGKSKNAESKTEWKAKFR